MAELADPSSALDSMGPAPIGADGFVDGYNVVGWIKKKLIFVSNPKPVLSKRYKAPTEAQIAAAAAGARVKVWGDDGSAPSLPSTAGAGASARNHHATGEVATSGASVLRAGASAAGTGTGIGEVPRMGSLEEVQGTVA